VPEQPIVFVLMPFDEAFTDVYTDLIKAPLESLGFLVTRADSLFNQQQILKDVVKGIADAALVVADVTDLNENVLYELGLAHALGKRAVMITQKLDQLPFDLRPYRANEYSTQFNKAQALKELLADIGKAVLDGTAEFSNPVQDFAPYALSTSAQVANEPVAPAHNNPAATSGSRERHISPPSGDDDDDEPGFLEQAIALQRGSGVTTTAAEQIARITEDIGAKVETHTQRMGRATSSLGDRAAGAQLAIARDVARDLDGYSETLAGLTEELRIGLHDMASGANALARVGSIDDDEDATAAEQLIETMAGAEDGMASGRTGIEGFAQVLLSMPNMDRVLTRALRRAGKTVTETAEEIQNAEAEFARARGLLQERVHRYRRGDA